MQTVVVAWAMYLASHTKFGRAPRALPLGTLVRLCLCYRSRHLHRLGRVPVGHMVLEWLWFSSSFTWYSNGCDYAECYRQARV
jgi:hypothetical protein